MKLIAALSLSVMFLSCASGKETKYAGSTPANQVVRAFLEIPSADSVDFIRWHIAFENDKYTLQCNYGVGKPNTRDFINGGKWVELHGTLKKDGKYYHLQNTNRTLSLIELNPNLLHILDAEHNLSVGTGGWSYTLNRISPSITDDVNIEFRKPILKDSMAYHGRTPCGVPGMKSLEKPCYKLKWYLVFYADPKRNEPRGYRLRSVVREHSIDKVGEWQIIIGKQGRIIYQLKNDTLLINLVKLDDQILAFADSDGKLLVGDEDFSYTLSRKF